MGEETIENYINAKERLATCAYFGLKVTCSSYIEEGKPETCLECCNYLNSRTLDPRTLEDLASMAVMSGLLSNAD